MIEKKENLLLASVSNKLEVLRNDAAIAKTELTDFFILAIIAVFVLSMIFSFLASKKLSRNLRELSKSVELFISNSFKSPVSLSRIKADNEEIHVLKNSFRILQNEISGLVTNLNEAVAEKTAAYNEQNAILQTRTKEILDSLHYARGLQKALLFGTQKNASMPNTFLYSRPKDIVSGDFIWSQAIGSKGNQRYLCALGDCTGHGVPACLLSIFGYNTLDQIVQDTIYVSPSILLLEIRKRLSEIDFDDKDSYSREGMCLSICEFNPHDLSLKIAGSYQTVSLVQNGIINNIKGDRIEIKLGKKDYEEIRFNEYHYQLSPNDMVYMYSDGYADQFGELSGKKLKKKNFLNILLQNSKLKVNDQKKNLDDAFISWKGESEQIDDVTVLGFKVSEKLNLFQKKEKTNLRKAI